MFSENMPEHSVAKQVHIASLQWREWALDDSCKLHCTVKQCFPVELTVAIADAIQALCTIG